MKRGGSQANTASGPVGAKAGAKPAAGAKGVGAKAKKKEETKSAAPADEFVIPESEVIVPDDQIKLTPEQKEEDVTRVLTANDPNCPNNFVMFHYKDAEYKKMPSAASDHIAYHFSLDGSVLHKSSTTAKEQLERKRQMEEALEERKRKLIADAREAGDEASVSFESLRTGKNQFDYTDRAAQTFINVIRERIVSTQPPETLPFAANVTQWDIYDAYIEEWERIKAHGEDGSLVPVQTAAVAGNAKSVIHSEKMGKSLRIMERMVNQNAEDEIYQDFKYWEDASDQFRQGAGTLLPLWRFSDNRARRKQVTCIRWNPQYKDMFVVGYGSYDFLKQGSGIIQVFSLKSTANAQSNYYLDSGVMCLEFHPQHASLLAVGLYDGNVRVYDVRRTDTKALFQSNIRTGKHTDPVWEVHWQQEDLSKELNFYSVSADGRVANWTMSKNELTMETVMLLKLTGGTASNSNAQTEEDLSLTGLAGGCCFDFNKYQDHLFLVGTEEGKIHKCSKAYSGQYLQTYEGHHMAVYAVKWNPFHPRVFISCSADWTVKLWDHNLSVPILSWDLSTAVGDIAWASYSSTVFAAVSNDGKAHVFDLAENKHEQLCEQKIVKRARLTHVTFNNAEPILLVGDDRGGVNSLKLSPNLRKITPIPAPEVVKGQPKREAPTRRFVEVSKMDRMLASTDFKIEPTASAELAAAGENGGVIAEAAAPAAAAAAPAAAAVEDDE